jgi:DNA-binding NarL/FixJ family response regulator
VRTVASGRSTLDPRAAQLVLERLREQLNIDPASALSDQERHLLDLVAQGLTDRQIAERMSVAEQTAKRDVASLLAKLGLHRRSQAAAYGARLTGNRPG